MSGINIQQVASLLDERFGLDALWVFGSEATGTTRDDSDLDLAALFVRRPQPAELLEARLDLLLIVDRDVDLVDLDSAPPVLQMQVLRTGHLVIDNNPGHRIRLIAAAPGRYEDLKINRREAERALRERVRTG